ncbi:MAG: glutamine--tRNA ligase/YqeY domain fusion protein [Deltaproteobacteria bacterium]|nr:glutamine--tRNA ligase/YqeY domain fusion protein [Deltaproteobacteria bacterium]
MTTERDTGTTGTEGAAAQAGEQVNFIEEIIKADIAAAKHAGRVQTRFPPEPNGYLHIGHAKAIHVDFGLAKKHGGACNLRFDDTNPTKEDVEYVDSIRDTVQWLGFQWAGEFYASDYFQTLYDYAEYLIQQGKAYVCDLTDDEASEYRGNFYQPGKESPFRNRSAAENLDLFRRMKAGEFPDGARVLRARIDVQHPNLNMRDPIMFRIRKVPHHRTGDAWCIYPMYDYAHCVSDAIEKITHSICTLEFEDHRPLYDWFLEQDVEGNFFARPLPRQIEFARLNLTYTLMSKRRLLQLVEEQRVSGWDDPRMPTLVGLRRRGYTPESLKAFCGRIGVAKRDSIVDVALLETAIREDLEKRAPRTLAVLRPLKLVIENYPEGQVDWLEVPNHPDDPSFGTRRVPFGRELFIERDDFREAAPKKWFRLAPGAEVRLRYACLVRCTGVIKDSGGEIAELRCTWDPASRGGNAPDGRKVKGTMHWVAAAHAVPAEVRLYERLFTKENPTEGGEDFRSCLDPNSLEVLRGCRVEPGLAAAKALDRFQFERLGYFCCDPDSTPAAPVFNRTVSLRDTWAKIEAQLKAG